MKELDDVKTKRISVRYSKNDYENQLVELKKYYAEDSIAATIRRAVSEQLTIFKTGELNG